MAMSPKELMRAWRIPDITTTPEYGELEKAAQYGYGSNFAYNAAIDDMRRTAYKGAETRRDMLSKFDSMFSQGGFSLGALNRKESELMAETASAESKIYLDKETENRDFAMKAQGNIMDYLARNFSLMANMYGTYRQLESSEDIARRQNESGGSWIVGAEYGLTSFQEELMQIWKRMMLRLSHGKRLRLRFWRAVFTGYHKASPWVVSQSMRSRHLLKARKWLVDNFVGYVWRDIWRHRPRKISEVAAAAIMFVISIAGWRFGRG